MARYTGPVCKICRREGEKLFLKGQRCYSAKCTFEKRAYPPGDHGRLSHNRSGRESDYARQLRAKQKARRVYGVLEKQFRRYYSIGLRRRGLTGLSLLQILETRMDSVVYRLGFAENRAQAREMVAHGHFTINGRRTNIPSMIVRPGDCITVREGSRSLKYFKELPELAENRSAALWVDRDIKSMTGRVLRLPERAEIDGNLNEQLIVEYYSR